MRELVPFIEISFAIECGLCGNGTSSLSSSSAIAAAKEFHNDGWRVEDDEVKCPECAGTEPDANDSNKGVNSRKEIAAVPLV